MTAQGGIETVNTNMDKDEQFDIIYAGNLFHHVDIETTLQGLIPHLSSKAKDSAATPKHSELQAQGVRKEGILTRKRHAYSIDYEHAVRP